MDKDFARGERMMRRPDLQQGQQSEADQLQNSAQQRGRFQPSWVKQGVISDTDDDVLPPIPAHLKTNAWMKRYSQKDVQLDQTPIALSNAAAPQQQISAQGSQPQQVAQVPTQAKAGKWKTEYTVQPGSKDGTIKIIYAQPNFGQGEQDVKNKVWPANFESSETFNKGALSGTQTAEFNGQVLRVNKEGKTVAVPFKKGVPFQFQPGDHIQQFFKDKPNQQQTAKGKPDYKKMPYGDKLSAAMKLVPGMLKGDAKALFQKLTTDPAFAATLAAGGAAFAALQFTPVGPAIDAAFMVAFGLKAGFELGKFFVDAFQAKDEAGIKAAAESLKNAIEDGGPVLISGLAGGLKSATGLLNKLKGGKQAGQTAAALSRLRPQQVAQFEEAIALRNAGKGTEAEAILGQLRSTLGKANFKEIESQILARLGHKTVSGIKKQTPRVGSQIDDKKFDYLFGRASGREHNLARTNQNALEMKRLGIPDTPKGHAMLRSHLDNAVQDNSNIIRAFNNEWGSFEVRESLFAGLSGKFSKFESTWQVLPDGTRRFSTLIPRGGGGK